MPRIGIILANTGTPSAPTAEAVKAYLKQFLMDRRIAPMNRLGWWIVVNAFILPRRAQASADKYQAIWTPQGSPFAVAHRRLAEAVGESLRREFGDGVDAVCGMSYGEPSLLAAFEGLRRQGCSAVVVLPLYPQSAHCTTGSVGDRVEGAVARLGWDVPCRLVGDYHAEKPYVQAIAASVAEAGFDAQDGDRLLFSYHSVPLADIEEGDTYDRQCEATSEAVAQELGLAGSQWSMAYQSRFDKKRAWLTPSTAESVQALAREEGRLFIICPGFATECLETMHDIGRELKPLYREARRKAGLAVPGDDLEYVPCLDKTQAHVKVLCSILHPYIEEANDA